MKKLLSFVLLVFLISCKQQPEPAMTAQKIVDSSIQDSGGEYFRNHEVSFLFRDRKYISKYDEQGKSLERYTYLDSIVIRDKRTNEGLERFINDSLIALPDSIARRYSNSVNSVHYFVKLPYGLNDKAVNKILLSEVKIKDKDYYKIKVTFDQDMGGEDFEDVYLYWFNKATLKPDYLAYDFRVNGGGQRFREAYNERYVDSIRFVDYNNYKPKTKGTDIFEIDRLFEAGELELLSKIELSEIEVKPN
ncbi:DUF6503 family protein [Flagellimonas allohymeniacidonis]|uniref:Deoxyribose-phosphate aldolase n=1 Tax=Flagellimonas allohymeniacidonis TaxID=2517819 RepID=A0A4Q8QH20_9FLAO|nr:DUF6503 family protein [Allomuricauda hymeniacidonis]TAI49047.1 deoxyribose-phosphate aldolase [Allomuricauda hymeniacidonis]